MSVRKGFGRFFKVAALAPVLVMALACPQKEFPKSTEPSMPVLSVRDRRIVDERGSAVILRGAAVNQIGDYFVTNPEVPSTLPLAKKDFEDMAAMGMNSVRLIVSWSLLEPEPGVHDEKYLARVKEAVEWARENRVYVILDMHQDAWGKFIESKPDRKCPWPLVPNPGWDGAPEWATYTDGKERCMIGHREFSLAVWRAWEAFWQNRDGIQDRFIETWAWVASEFKDDTTVVGYDLLNEPNWGEHYFRAIHKSKPLFYEKAVPPIRAAEAGGRSKLIFFEPMAVWSALPGENPVRFTDDPNIVYAPHIYLGSISIDVFLFGRELIPLRHGFEQAKKEADEFNTTFWNGEWMPGPGDHPYRLAALEDEFQTGSARWIWKSSCGDPHHLGGQWPDQTAFPEGTIHSVIMIKCGDRENPAGVEAGVNPIDAIILTRPYPRAFPAPAKWTSDPKTRDFEIAGESAGGIPLTVWFPGDTEPRLETEGAGEVIIEKVNGGFMIHATPGAGKWSLRAAVK